MTDTPGLLPRPDADRNAMEQLTIAALEHLPTVVLFVADGTGTCGTSVAAQWSLRTELRARFPQKPWVDILSKADLLAADSGHETNTMNVDTLELCVNNTDAANGSHDDIISGTPQAGQATIKC